MDVGFAFAGSNKRGLKTMIFLIHVCTVQLNMVVGCSDESFPTPFSLMAPASFTQPTFGNQVWVKRSEILNQQDLCDGPSNNCFRRQNSRVWFSKPDGSELSQHQGIAVASNVLAAGINSTTSDVITMLQLMQPAESVNGYKYKIGDVMYFRDPTLALIEVTDSWTATASSGAGDENSDRGALWLIKPFPGDESEHKHTSIHEQGFQGRGMWTGGLRMTKNGNEESWLDFDFGESITVNEIKIFRQCADEYLERVPREFQVQTGGQYGARTNGGWSDFGPHIVLTKDTIMSDPPYCSRNRHRPGQTRSVDVSFGSSPFKGRYMRIKLIGNFIQLLHGQPGFSFVGTNSGVQELEAIEFFREMKCDSLAPTHAPTVPPTASPLTSRPTQQPSMAPSRYFESQAFFDNITALHQWVKDLDELIKTQDRTIQSQKKMIESQSQIISALKDDMTTSKTNYSDLRFKIEDTRAVIRNTMKSLQASLDQVDNDYSPPPTCEAAGVLPQDCVPKVSAEWNVIDAIAKAGDFTIESHRCGKFSPCTSSLQIEAIADALASLKDI